VEGKQASKKGGKDGEKGSKKNRKRIQQMNSSSIVTQKTKVEEDEA
jgi:hypothetical protein